MTRKKYLVLLGVVLAAAILIAGCSRREAASGDTVRVHYTGTLADGSQFDSSIGRDPLEFTLGAGRVIAGFENAVYGMKKGQTKTITIPAEDAYGPYRNDLVLVMKREELPAGLPEPEVGVQTVITFPDGRGRSVRITDVTETTVTFDANHRLAGKDLTFEIKLVDVR